MLVSVASEPTKLGSLNLDWVAATDRVAIVLDGLTEGPETGCIHGTAWFVHQLGSRLLLHAGEEQTKPLSECLASALDEVASIHRDTCDLQHRGSPCTTVTMIRQRGREIDYLVLADSPLILDILSEPLVIIDESEKLFSASLERNARGGTQSEFTELILDQQQFRNRDSGYWVAQVDPDASKHALQGTLRDVRGAVLASDGAALLVTDFQVMDWREYLSFAYREGPQGLIRATREMEASDPERTRWPRYKVSDDATAAICRL